MIHKPMPVKTAVVTGAVSGMGLGLTRHLLSKSQKANAAEQWRVVLVDIDEDGYEQIKESLPEDLHLFARADVSKFSEILAAFNRAFEWSGGRIDFFANNAGVPDRHPLLSWLGDRENVGKGDPGEPDLATIAIDLNAVIYGLQCFVHFTRRTRKVLAQNTGQEMSEVGIDGTDAAIGVHASHDFHPKMVITASMAALYPFHILPLYTAAKHGALGFVRASAPMLYEDEGITLNAICPSTVKTGILPPAMVERWSEDRFTPVETIIRAWSELIDVNVSCPLVLSTQSDLCQGYVNQDGLSNGHNGRVKNGCCVEATQDRLFYRNPVEFPSECQEWIIAQSRREGLMGRFMMAGMKAKKEQET
jgi:15-hydroxyprostaglandin dehydrogenase (NAD)